MKKRTLGLILITLIVSISTASASRIEIKGSYDPDIVRGFILFEAEPNDEDIDIYDFRGMSDDMKIVYRNDYYLILIDDNNYNSNSGLVISFAKVNGDSGIEGKYEFETDELEYQLLLNEDMTFEMALYDISDDDSDEGDDDDSEDDAPDKFCFISVSMDQ